LFSMSGLTKALLSDITSKCKWNCEASLRIANDL